MPPRVVAAVIRPRCIETVAVVPRIAVIGRVAITVIGGITVAVISGIAVAISVVRPCQRASDKCANCEAANRGTPPSSPSPSSIRRRGRGNRRYSDACRCGESGQGFSHFITPNVGMVEVSTVTLAQVFRARPPVMNGGLLHRTRRNLHLSFRSALGPSKSLGPGPGPARALATDLWSDEFAAITGSKTQRGDLHSDARRSEGDLARIRLGIGDDERPRAVASCGIAKIAKPTGSKL